MVTTGFLGLVHWDDPVGWYGEEGGRELQDVRVHLWWIHVDVWQNQYNIVSNKPPIKINKFILKKKHTGLYQSERLFNRVLVFPAHEL